MAVFRCKMCGGDLEIREVATVCVCQTCGTRQTVPTVTNESLRHMFNRANVLRIKGEFDKAAELYRRILHRSERVAEAYWGLVLCRYGVEYVEDPRTHEWGPVCHRASHGSLTVDTDYRNAVRYSDPERRKIYQEEAEEIDRVRSEIIELARKEELYDVFICYKQSTESGKRTRDSGIVRNIHDRLTQAGFKVLCAAITPEEPLGLEYEPIVFSAVNTAKVMLVVGTDPAFFNSVWVRNEWSRFMKTMRKDRKRLLIPCYGDMDPYELPEEFMFLPALDTGKDDFIPDLIGLVGKAGRAG